MSRLSKYIIPILIVFSLGLYAFYPENNPNKFEWNTFNIGLEKAKKEKKKIFIDVYADWCKWCKKMDADVYTNPDIQKYLKEKYIAIKFNGEAATQITYNGERFTHAELTQAFQINGFPATVFMKPDGEPISVVPGYHSPGDFLKILKFIGDDHYLSTSYEEYLRKNK